MKNRIKSQTPKAEIKSDKTLVDYPSDDDDDEDEDRLKIHEDPSTEEESEKSAKTEEKSNEGKEARELLTDRSELFDTITQFLELVLNF